MTNLIIRINRKHTMIDLFRSYKVLLNNREVGRIKNGNTVELEVQPGTHCVQLQIDGCFSNPVEFECKDELIEFECGNNYQGKRVFAGVLNMLGSRGEYLWLKQKENS